MKDVKVTIGAANVKALTYDNRFGAKPNEQVKLNVKTQVAIELNPAAPTQAAVRVRFECNDGEEEKKNMVFVLDTITLVEVNTFVDNLDAFIKANFLNEIMVGVNEKIRMVSGSVGVNISTPPIVFDAKA